MQLIVQNGDERKLVFKTKLFMTLIRVILHQWKCIDKYHAIFCRDC